ncbi:MAG: transposase [Bacteroidota bacterium]
MNNFSNQKISYTEIGKIYFWTATINKWQRLFDSDTCRKNVINSISYLASKELVDVFGFVLMPNHIHLIWRMNKLNGKEKPFGSFLKFTAHEFKKQLTIHELSKFKIEANNKEFEFWQQNPMAIELYSPKVAYQKLDCIHHNPLSKNWNLANEPQDYKYSSASYYETGDTKFPFLKHLGEEF